MVILGTSAVLLPNAVTRIHAASRIYTTDTAPTKSVAIVYGAGLRRDGEASAVLRDRIRRAVDLYFAGKVDILLMSGDNRSAYYNEPAAMMRYAVRQGVPESAIVLDFAGQRTYDTCYRAQAIFGLEDAILVTQAYHLPRALYTCQQLGVDAVGVAAYESRYWPGAMRVWTTRELLATTTALWDVYVRKPLPTLGVPTPIFPLEAQ